MNGAELNEALCGAFTRVTQHADELRDLDQQLGDGDLGITVSLGADAVIQALEELEPDALPADIARTCARAFANANPSTMAALVAGALLAGSRVWGDRETVSAAAAGEFVQAAAESIATRGKTTVGDKTILDALVPVGEAISHADDGQAALTAAVTAASRGVAATRELQARRGRASWLQERSIGVDDPGATALLRFLESWRDASADGERIAK